MLHFFSRIKITVFKRSMSCRVVQGKFFSAIMTGLFLTGCLLLGVNGLEGKALAATPDTETYTVKDTDNPIDKKYQKRKNYNKKSKQYYTLRSYLELLERRGGGTLILSAGTYEICNTLYVASNITILLKDGVVILK